MYLAYSYLKEAVNNNIYSALKKGNNILNMLNSQNKYIYV